ncbi:MAG TPA: hypothetical protein VNI34_07235 [Candidatus Nitrosotalea sp.]|nr:hypothetical protein [Candidatus Nitrosotalea sp.]
MAVPKSMFRAYDRVEANARLTGAAGVILLVLLAAEGFTVLSIGRLLPWHYFFGLVLIPPVVLKLGSTGTRFLRYYAGAPDYRRAGPPALLLRLLGPLVILLTLAVLASGVELWAFGLRFGSIWITAHKATFVLWFLVMSVHVLAYLERAPALALRDLTRPLPGAGRRRSLLGASLLLGVVLALALMFGHPSPFSWLGGG